MNKSTSFTPALLLALLAWPWVQAEQARNVPVAEYQRQVHAMAEKIAALREHPEQASGLVSEIPGHLAVTTGAGEIDVNFKSLKDDLAAFSRADQPKRSVLLPKLLDYARELDAAAQSFEKNGENVSSARGKLDQILSRREFKKVRGPTAKDALLARIYRWLSRMLSKLALKGGSGFELMQLLIYLLVGAAVCVLAIWTFRRLGRPREEPPRREIIPFSPSARGWRSWLADARALAQQQDWRNAIHMAYWAAIAYLEEHGAWKPNRARTPREYLRLIGTRGAQYPVLAALTRKLETVWYGYGEALESDFQEALGQLEKLGCR